MLDMHQLRVSLAVIEEAVDNIEIEADAGIEDHNIEGVQDEVANIVRAARLLVEAVELSWAKLSKPVAG